MLKVRITDTHHPTSPPVVRYFAGYEDMDNWQARNNQDGRYTIVFMGRPKVVQAPLPAISRPATRLDPFRPIRMMGRTQLLFSMIFYLFLIFILFFVF